MNTADFAGRVALVTQIPVCPVGDLQPLRELAEAAGPLVEQIKTGDATVEVFAAVTALAERWEHLDGDQCKELLEAAPFVIEALSGLFVTTLGPELHARARAMIRYAVTSVSEQVRGGGLKHGLERLEVCASYLDMLDPERSGNRRLRAQILLSRGQILHRLARNDEAIRDLHDALDLLSKKSEDLHDRPGQSADHALHWLKFRCVQILRALAFVHYRQGALRRASSCVSAAKLLNMHYIVAPDSQSGRIVSDDITRESLAVLAVAIRRAMSGSASPIESLARSLKKSLSVFEKFAQHSRILRTNYELAVTYRQRPHEANTAEVTRLARLVIDQADERGDIFWVCFGKICLSRVSDRTTAIRLSSEAIRHAESFHLDVCEIEALLARGTAYLLSPPEPAKARKDFDRVLKFETIANGANPRLRMQCECQMAESFLIEKRMPEASAWIERAAHWIKQVEHAKTTAAYEAARKRLGSGENFLIEVSNRRTVAEHERALHRWLIDHASSPFKGETAVAQELGITRRTLRRWKKELAGDSAKAAPRATGKQR